MAKTIKAGIAGIVTVHANGGVLHLKAGDAVPAGVKVDDDLLEVQSGTAGKSRRRTKADS